MGHQKLILLILMTLIMLNISLKWSNTLMMLIMLESATAMVLGMILMQTGMNMIMITILFPFFVSEATILLTTLMGIMRLVGTTYGSTTNF